MTTYDDILKANATLKPINFKDKPYAPVNERIKAFRMVHPEGAIVTEIISNTDGVIVMRATVMTAEGSVLGTGTAYEKESSSYINKTSYVENCETSAVGRALGMAGYGVDGSMCSAEELVNALKQQEEMKAKDHADMKAESKAQTAEVANLQTRADIVKDYCARVGMTQKQFGEYKRGAIANGFIPDKMVNQLSEEEFQVLMNFVEANRG